MPALGGFVEGVVIAFPLVFNKVLKADIAPDLKPGLIEKEQGQQPRASPWPI